VSTPWPGPCHYRTGASVLAFDAIGPPVGQGAIRHLGKGRPAIHQNAKTLLPWRDVIGYRALAAMRGHPCGWPIAKVLPVAVDLTFTVPKPAVVAERRRTYPVTRPDIDHLERAVLDALTIAGVWVDDSQVVAVSKRKTYPAEHPRALRVPGLSVAVYVINADAPGGCEAVELAAVRDQPVDNISGW
jgi:Holliday junction resolvase RusA-like endonuclease